MAKDKRDHRTMSHNGFRDNFNYATKGWDKKKRDAFHTYLRKELWDEKDTWEKGEMVRQAEIWSTYYWWG